MTRYRVGHGASFVLDRCAACGGVWLDANEWETLKTLDLSEQMHQAFSAAWQAENLRQERAAHAIRRLRQLLGESDFDKLNRDLQWIDTHRQRPVILDHLTDWIRERRQKQPPKGDAQPHARWTKHVAQC
jgi:Zn-finger nucleic acid-binding protein